MTETPQPPSFEGGPTAVARRVRWPEDLDVTRRLFVEYRQWLADHRDPAPEAQDRVKAGLGLVDRLISELPREYGPAHGDILLWFERTSVVACGALRELEPGIAEIRRIYVRGDYRGKEFGRPFVIALIDLARTLHFKRIRADALSTMYAAIEFYEELGFHRVPAYWPYPAAGALFFEREVDLPADLDSASGKS